MAKDPLLKKFGANVASLRKQAGLTQDELAERAEIGPKFISKLERGEANPSLLTMHALAVALGTSIGKVAGESDPDAEIAALLSGRATAERQHAAVVLKALFWKPVS